MTEKEWIETMVKELNAAGFKRRGFNSETEQWEDNCAPYEVNRLSPTVSNLILGALNRDEKPLEYLKSIGLINNGRCPMCGESIEGTPCRFTNGYNHDFHFQICNSCYSRGRKTSLNPAQNSGCGCVLALLLMPFDLFKSLIQSIFN